ncbi:hypothetical protein AB434_2281 [Heyndrickxia coagulans]|uniref:Uncharacterized protein n=1 Tax=Heyndrickxia coagulans TaxID=1398 RepID=A0AAN0T8J0_HEYCO|nr:hypothetical protein SB48_HM08orf04847 [Heyndrickxia coagulans]AKN54686.1 hypothetical protein AB434_2281 [Heyndrickxia coagulans]
MYKIPFFMLITSISFKMFKWLSGHLMINKKRQRKFPYFSFFHLLL